MIAAHQQRVIDERDDLAIKVDRLHAFLGTDTYAGLDVAERGRLDRQLAVMVIYRDILNERIVAFV